MAETNIGSVSTIGDRKKISKLIPPQALQEDAETRTNGVDKPTCFSIPGSNLPARHCNVDLLVNVAVTSDMSVYVSLNSGNIQQKVYGTKYNCRIFCCPYQFSMTIPTGDSSWDRVQFKSMPDGNPLKLSTLRPGEDGYEPGKDVYLLTSGRVVKGYDKNTYDFEWVFKNTEKLEEGGEYTHEKITTPHVYDTSITDKQIQDPPGPGPGLHHGGFSRSDAGYVYCGSLEGYGWKKGLNGEAADGKLWICGGILYDTAKITATITSESTFIKIPGLNLATYYYPGDIQKAKHMSLNRPEGYLKICNPSRTAEYLIDPNDSIWRDVKNTENDFLTKDPKSGFENWGFRLEGDTWVRLILSGDGGVATDPASEEGGIGSDDGSTSSTNGVCCCCQRK